MTKVYANGRSVVHKGDGQTNTCPVPDVCKTPSPGGPVPVPYVNVAQDGDLAKGTQSVSINGNPIALKDSNLSTSSGDEAGTAGGGLVSSKTKGKMTWASSSIDVKFEGKGVIRFLDICLHNGNTTNTGGQPTQGSANQAPPSGVSKCPPHQWEIRTPRESRTVAEKRKRLAREARESKRKGDRDSANSYVFEGKAAKHNKVTDGNDMSGANDASKLYVHCKICNKRNREVDHVLRDKDGNISAVVEVKSGNAEIKPKQLYALKEITSQLGASLVYKLQQGDGAPKASEFLQKHGHSADNIIVI